MKKQVFGRLLVSFILGFIGTALYAQDTLSTLPPVTVTATSKAVPDKVWANFEKTFSNAENPKWFQANKNYLVKFMTDEDLNHALFTKRGSLVYHISYGVEKNLPEDLRKQVKSTYFDYNITRAIKVTEADRLIWVVNLEDAKNLILVRLEDGEMEEVQKLDKAG